jgi:hypothetical protein
MSVRHGWKSGVLTAAFEQYSISVRGISKSAAHDSARAVFRRLRVVLGDDPIDLRELRGSDVVEFIVATASVSGPYMARAFGDALRAFFR